ncbi:unnamed protein product [Caenorhabditis auriculariae]|uniref:Vacuolar protein sorting-associated protein 52 homolog n=1 Tax=Caenorhabditis auriculariae TaxID=2777116 RepID=A0A8S1H1B4_9PELO|nr:unnamed protein product [Caenorhabditis auriculariae]
MDKSFTKETLEACLTHLARADSNVVRQALDSGEQLQESSEDVGQKLSEAHKSAVQECIAQADKLVTLHTQIESCDRIFERLQNMLCSFQDNLGSIGEDMKQLQVQSLDIHQELENRQKVRAELSQFVDDIVVPQNMIGAIVGLDPNERGFIEALHELHHKINLINSRGEGEALAVHDALPVLENLKIKAVEKVREWLLLKIYMFRKPLSNYQIFQHQLLKSRFFYEFTLKHDPAVAQEIQDEYIDTISKMFFTYFKAYASRLFKLMMKDAATKEDVLGATDVVKGGAIAGLFGSKPQVRNRATVFSLGSRDNVLTTDFLSALIVPHAATQNNQTFQFEALFRSLQLAFVDHYSHEYLFVADFFVAEEAQAVDLHSKAMSRAVSVLLKSCEEQIALSWDAISLHLCVCLSQKFHSLLAEREVPTMNAYWETLTNILWVRFDQVMTGHNESVRILDIKKLQQNLLDTRPHYIVRRYAELTSAFLTVTKKSGRDIGPKMEALLESSEDAVEQLLARMASLQQNPRDRILFLINNYDLILGIIDDHESKQSRIHAIVHELEQKCIDEFVEVILNPHLGDIMKLVSECEPLATQGHTQLLVRYNDKLSSAVLTFNQKWKPSIEAIHQDITKLFTNFRLGSHILQAIFSKYIQYVQRFSKITTHETFLNNSTCSELVNVHQVMSEVKKFKPVY